MTDRSILHCDLNNFFASVEMIDRPELENFPMAVCGDPSSRHGIILSKNEEAKKFGVKTAETIVSAKYKCPELVLVPSDHKKYIEYSDMVRQVFLSYTELVEPFGIDEAWIDVSDLEIIYGNAEKLAYEIKERVKKELSLTLSIGVSFNKVFAKIGSDYKKPDAVTVIDRENYKDILYPMPVDSMIFVGNKTRDALKRINIKTIGELAEISRQELISLFGKAGNNLYDIVSGVSDDDVKSYYEKEDVKSIGNGQTFTRDICTESEIKRAILMLSDKISKRLRKAGKLCSCVKVTLKTPGFVCFDKQKKLNTSTDVTAKIYESALSVFESAWTYDTKIRMLTVAVSGLSGAGTGDQFSLEGAVFDGKADKKTETYQSLDFVTDEMKNRFGISALFSASLSSNSKKPAIEMDYGDLNK